MASGLEFRRQLGTGTLEIAASAGEGKGVYMLQVLDGEREVALAEFHEDGPGRGHVEDVWVDPGHRRRGIATALYDAIEAAGYEVEPAGSVDEDGLLFWESRMARRGAAP